MAQKRGWIQKYLRFFVSTVLSLKITETLDKREIVSGPNYELIVNFEVLYISDGRYIDHH